MRIKTKSGWVSLALLNLFVVALLGVVLRSKALFDLPFIDYNRLLEVHSHFAFGGWVTLALCIVLTQQLLPGRESTTPYTIVFASVFLLSWARILVLPLKSFATCTNIVSLLFILSNYFFAWVFIRDMRKEFRLAKITLPVYLLALGAVICMLLSSAGPIILIILFSVHATNAIIYRDMLYSYLHLQYNGFFTLAIFALLLHLLYRRIGTLKDRYILHFSVCLLSSILPSMFLSYHWHDPNVLFHLIAYAGSAMLLLSLWFFIPLLRSLMHTYRNASPLSKWTGGISLSAFILKMFLQSCTIFNVIGNLVFGDRVVIIGFLHLVFLGFVTPFLILYFASSGVFNEKSLRFKIAWMIFFAGVILSELLLWLQGIGAMFLISFDNFPSLIWGASILLAMGAFLLFNTRKKVMGDAASRVE